MGLTIALESSSLTGIRMDCLSLAVIRMDRPALSSIRMDSVTLASIAVIAFPSSSDNLLTDGNGDFLSAGDGTTLTW